MTSRGHSVHATTVNFGGQGVLITGPSGSGKSALALQLMAFGAGLVSDDLTCLTRAGETVLASAPAGQPGRIEARGIGILSAGLAGPTPVALIVDLGQEETERLPDHHNRDLMGVSLPVVHKIAGGHLAAAIVQYMRGGRCDPHPN